MRKVKDHHRAHAIFLCRTRRAKLKPSLRPRVCNKLIRRSKRNAGLAQDKYAMQKSAQSMISGLLTAAEVNSTMRLPKKAGATSD